MPRLAPAGQHVRRTVLLLAACTLAVPRAASAVAVWTALSAEKIRPSEPARAAPAAKISAARNEFESFQVVVTGPASGVRATASALVGPGRIDAVRLHRVELIALQNASSTDSPGVGLWPDALVPDVDDVVQEQRNAFPFDVAGGQSRAIWADVFVPPTAPPGTYSGTVQVTWSGGAATVPVTLTVWPFALPSTPSLKSAFGLSWGSLIAAHGVQDNTAAFSELRARYGQLALDHRISLSTIDDGNQSLDHLAAYYGTEIDGAAPTRLAGARLTNVNYLGSSTAYGAWATFFTGRGWFDRLFQYTCDEPSDTSSSCTWSNIAPRAQAAKAANPNFRTLVTTTIQDADAHGVTGSIDVLVPVINFLDDKSGQFQGEQRPAYDAFLAAKPGIREVWGYQSCMSHGCGGTSSYYTGWPTYMIDAEAVRNRAMEWLSFRYRLSGELYYETTMAYGGDAWTNQWYFSGNGDGTLFYPGTVARIGGSTDIPVASIRLKMIRDGMEDYEYLKLLSDSGPEGDAYARQIAQGLFPQAYETAQDPQKLAAAREAIAARLVSLGVAGAPATSGAGGTGGTGVSGTGAAGDAPLHGGCAAGGAAGLAALAGLTGAIRLRRRRR